MSDLIKYSIEIPINSSVNVLYKRLSTPSGLAEWFADNVNSRGELFTFIWDDSEEQAKLITKKSSERIKFKWLDSEDDSSFFELRIQVDSITKDVSIIVTDFSDDDEVEESKMLWENQISSLKQVLGSR